MLIAERLCSYSGDRMIAAAGVHVRKTENFLWLFLELINRSRRESAGGVGVLVLDCLVWALRI